MLVVGILAGCDASRPTDTAGIEADVVAIPGVTDVDAGVSNAGAPGSYVLDTALVVDAPADADQVAHILRLAAAVVARRAPDVGRYGFSVSTVSTVDPSFLEDVALEDVQEEIGLPGTYSGNSLELTGEQLTSIVVSTRVPRARPQSACAGVRCSPVVGAPV